MNISLNKFDAFLFSMKTLGFYIIKNCISNKSLLDNLRIELDRAIETDKDKISSYEDYRFCDIVHHLFDRGKSFIDLFEDSVINEYIEKILGSTYIIHSYNAVRLMPGRSNNATKIHRDSPRYYPPVYPLSIQALVCVDQFNSQTGGTYLLPASHHIPDKPTDEYFYTNAFQVQADPGDVVIFDSLIWHAGGNNTSDHPRRGITLVYTRSFMKQQIDIPRSLSPELIESLSDSGKRLIGFNVRVPSNVDEFYLPQEKRLYKANQG